MQDEMMDLMDVSSEIQESLGRSYNVPDDIDEDELMGGKLEFILILGHYFLVSACILWSFVTVLDSVSFVYIDFKLRLH